MRLLVPRYCNRRTILHRQSQMIDDSWRTPCGRLLVRTRWMLWTTDARPIEAAAALGAGLCKNCWNTRRMRRERQRHEV